VFGDVANHLMVLQNGADSGAIVAAHVGGQTELGTLRQLIVAGQTLHLLEDLENLLDARGADRMTHADQTAAGVHRYLAVASRRAARAQLPAISCVSACMRLDSRVF
jgi:hypothetical protein